jgi:SAM-dependent methyltransferase
MQSSSAQRLETKPNELPWQLQLFRLSLKKQQKLRALLAVLGKLDGLKCLLITCGDNNGALNWHFKEHGGEWSWADAEVDGLEQIGRLTGDPVAQLVKQQPELPFPGDAFDLVVTIDVHEHLKDPQRLNQELYRLAKPGGRVVVTTPNGNPRKLATRIKRLVGMRPEDYGHVVIGYDVPELEAQLLAAGLKPNVQASYARFFTEMLELSINFVYVKVLSGRSKAGVEKGQIAPQNLEQVKSVAKTIQLYSRLYPVFQLISRLDVLDISGRGYAVIVGSRKE